jgi:DNA recombination protein RmuC
MNLQTFWMVACFAAVIAAAILWLRRRLAIRKEESAAMLVLELQREMAALRSALQTQVLELSRQMNMQLENNTRFLRETHDGYSRAVGQVQHRLGQLQEATQSMVEIGKDISSLQNILKAPKLRGGLGELFLAELLKQILPEDHFSLQYTFRDGTKVDAVILLGQGMIPVDAKFPLENFQRILDASGEEAERSARKNFIHDVRKHIEDIAAKYILPEEGTFEFALMYIPAENVYYETIIKDELQPESIASYALRKKVIPVSPNSFYAYLQAIVRGLKGLRIERSAQLILESLGQLESDFKKCFMDFEKVGGHLSNAQSAYGKALRRFERLEDKLCSIESWQKPLGDAVPEGEVAQETPETLPKEG